MRGYFFQGCGNMLTLRRIAPWCFAVALIIYLRPYTGIRHDAALYLAQALRILDPDIYNKDLFFLAGSQADFTIFPRFLASLLRQFDPGSTFLVLTMAGRLLFFLASVLAIRAIFPRSAWWPALFALIIMPTQYGSDSIFAYAEPFLTSRPFAEALSLSAIALLVSGRPKVALLFFAFAASLHPLQSLAAATVAWCWLVSVDRRWLWALISIAPIVGLAVIGIPPFSGLLLTIDFDWWELITTFSGQIYLNTWDARDWCIVITDVYLLYLLTRAEHERLASLATAALAALAVGFTATALLADLMQLVLPTGLQTWRVLWVAHWLAMAGIPYLVWQRWQRPDRDLVAVALLVAIVVTGASIARTTLPWAVLGLIPLHIAWPHLRSKVSRPIRYFMLIGLASALLAATFRYQLRAWIVYSAYGSDLERVRQDVVVLGYPLVAAVVVLGAYCIYRRSGAKSGALLGVLSLFMVLGAAWSWDARSPWSRTLEASRGADVFNWDIPRDASVYWYSSEVSPLGPWLVLNRANYFSVVQMAGQMFNRGTSIAGIERQLQLNPVSTQAEVCDFMNAMNDDPAACWIGEEGLRYMCTPYRDVPQPDYFVLPFKQKSNIIGHWQPRHPRTGVILGDFYLYRCKDWVEAGSTHPVGR